MIRWRLSKTEDIGLRARQIGLIAGPLGAISLQLLPAPDGLSQQGWATAAVALLMAVWWMSEAVPLAATALVPLVLFPLLGIGAFETAAVSYANPLIFLFLGGFILGKGLERWRLHRRLAMKVLAYVGQKPSAIIAGMMAITAFLSMWVSNTATTMVMLPIGQSIVATLCPRDAQTDAQTGGRAAAFAPALMLAIAFSATIGGMGTLIGTPPNAFFAAYMERAHGITIGFATWMLVGLPAVLLLLPATWLILTKIAFRVPETLEIDAGRAAFSEDFQPMTRPEWTVAGVMVLVSLLWLTRPLITAAFPGLPLSDAGIAMAGALALFVIPACWSEATFLLGWDDIKSLRWDVLILFGGGLALAGAIGDSGLAAWIGGGLGALAGLPAWTLIFVIMVVIVYLSELASNTATAAVFLPVAGAAAVGIGAAPLSLTLPVVLAASLGFMLPVATPPNAIVFGSGYVTIPQMVKSGFGLNLMGVVLISALTYALVIPAFGVVLNELPQWVLAAPK